MHPARITLNGRFLLQPVTGVQRVARELLAEFDRMAAADEIAPPRLLLPEAGEIVAPPALQAIVPERMGRWSGHAWEQFELPRLCGPEPLLCLGNTAPVSRLRRRGQPVVTMVHDLSYAYFPEAYTLRFRVFYGAVIPQVLRYSDRVVTVSNAEMDAIRQHFHFLAGSERLTFLPNGGLPDTAMRTAVAELERAPELRDYGLYVGSLTRRKNAEGILHAAITFLQRHPQMRFVVVGTTGTSFEGTHFDVPAEVADRLEFLGQVNEAERIYAAYRNARFLLFPSFYESSGLPPIEAMAFGCPVVSSRIPSLIERCGNASIYCDAHDQNSIADAIDSLMNNQPLWHQHSARSRAQAAGYTWAAQARGLLDLCGASK